MSPTFCEKDAATTQLVFLQALQKFFKNPSLLQFFMSHLLFGSHVVKVPGEYETRRWTNCRRFMPVPCPKYSTDRQVKHQTKKDGAGCKERSPTSQSEMVMLAEQCFFCSWRTIVEARQGRHQLKVDTSLTPQGLLLEDLSSGRKDGAFCVDV
ncbi:hypothetical protein GWK47_016582 [Chionoecetes opilio]|uniref:Uncharacterized protein n=1 Tax=Chionoecetes opilio TaxID=41210 RepID=A0A8J4XWG2_CHIOP|nr:hypothetical protein GWK47_016582 [Chionoecetes opilio]